MSDDSTTPRHTGSMRAGWGQELLVIPTVEVPPTNYDAITNQSGPEPSEIIAADSNVSTGIDIGIVGSMRQDDASVAEFPMNLRIVDASANSYRRPNDVARRIVEEFDRTGQLPPGVTIDYLTGLIRAGLTPAKRGGDHTVPRMSVRFASDLPTQTRVLKSQFKRFPADGFYLPLLKDFDAVGGSWGEGSENPKHYQNSTPALFYDRNNERLIIFNVYTSDTSYQETGQLIRLGAIAYKQGVNNDTTSAKDFWTLAGYSKFLWNDSTSLFSENEVVIRSVSNSHYLPPMATAVEFNGNIYVLVSDVENYTVGANPATDNFATTTGCGGFYVTLFNPADGIDDAFRPIVGPVKPSQSFATRLKGMSAASLRNAVVLFTDVDVNLNGDSSTFVSQVQYARSTDMKNWGGEGLGKGHPYVIGGADPVAREDDWKPIDIAIDINPFSPYKGEGWAVTGDHEILYTDDGGESWQLEAEFDAKINFNSICVVRTDLIAGAQVPDYRAFAFTRDGMVLRRAEIDGDITWEICGAANPSKLVGLTEYFMTVTTDGNTEPVDAKKLRINMPNVPIRGIAVQDVDKTRLWITGQSGLLRHSPNAGTKDNKAHFVRLPTQAVRSISGIRDIVFLNKDVTKGAYRLAIAGDIHGKQGARHQLGIISQEITENLIGTANFAFGSVEFTDAADSVMADTRVVNDLFFQKDNHKLFFCGNAGLLGVVDTTAFDGENATFDEDWLDGASKSIASDTTTDLTSVYNYVKDSVDILLFTDNAGSVWRSTPWYDSSSPNKNPWVRFVIDGSYISRTTETINTVLSAEEGLPEILMIITDKGLYRGNLLTSTRTYPTVIALEEEGHFLMACVNTTDNVNRVEIWRSVDGGLSFQLDPNQPENVKWSGTSVIGRPTLVEMDDGSILLSIDAENAEKSQKNFWSFDSGYTWVKNEDPTVPLNIGSFAFDVSSTDNSQGFFTQGGESAGTYGTRRRLTRAAIAYGGGPVYAVWQNPVAGGNRQAVFRLYDWVVTDLANIGGTNTLDDMVPPHIVPGKARWIGLDDIRVVFSGLPSVEDNWDINLRYRYDVRNIGIESPSVYYRSRTIDTVRLEWDRTDADVAEAIGSGTRWHVDSFALYGTNFLRCKIRISVPTWGDIGGEDVFPTVPDDNDQYIEFALDSIIERGEFNSWAKSHGSIVTENGKNWIPHQWKPGPRTYYVATYNKNDPDTIVQMVKILDNTEDTLILDQIALFQFDAYYIFGDRFFCDGRNGVLVQSGERTILPDIRGTQYQFCKFIQLEIPTQITHEAYFQIGSICFGTKTPIKVNFASDGGSRRRFSRGFQWQGEAKFQEDVGLTGVTSYQQFGRLQQAWTLQYEYIRWWDRDYTFGGLMDKPKRAFTILMDNELPHSIEWVRLAGSPQYQNISGDWYDFTLNLIEVV